MKYNAFINGKIIGRYNTITSAKDAMTCISNRGDIGYIARPQSRRIVRVIRF